jgi:hypothetical protein
MSVSPELIVERDGRDVHITMRFPDHYAALEFYDQIGEAARAGNLQLDLNIKSRPQ